MKNITIVLMILVCLALFCSCVPSTEISEPWIWETSFIERSSELGLIPDSFYGRYTQPITRAEFCAIAVLTFECVMDRAITEYVDFYDTNDLNVAKMAGMDVVRGVEENIFEPGREIKREEAAVLLANFMRALDRPLRGNWTDFADFAEISTWAQRAVGQIQAQGIMVGLDENVFAPKESFTIEQTIRAMLVAYDLATAPTEEKISVNASVAAGRKIPILMYHAISDAPNTALANFFVRPAELEAQLKYIAKKGYQSITFEDLDNIGAFSKPIMITFDDGYKDNYTILFPLLKKYNMRATIFVVTNTLWSEGRLSQEDIVEMSNSGLVSIQSHTKNHHLLTELERPALIDELSSSKDCIEELTGQPVMALCYPQGYMNAEVRAAAAEYYSYAVINSGGKFVCGENTMDMRRIDIKRGLSIWSFAARIR